MTNELFDMLFANGPRDKIFIELADGTSLTYGEFETATAKAAGTLSGLGVRAGDRVAAQVDKSVGALVLYLAVSSASAPE